MAGMTPTEALILASSLSRLANDFGGWRGAPSPPGSTSELEQLERRARDAAQALTRIALDAMEPGLQAALAGVMLAGNVAPRGRPM